MLNRIDRIQLAVPDRAAAATNWCELLGAEPAGEDRVICLGARRTRLRLGRGFVELLEPDGAGPLSDAISKRGAHLYAAGAATDDLARLVSHLRGRGVEAVVEAGQAFVDPAAAGQAGFRTVLSPDEALAPVGAVDFLYETTLLVSDADAAIRNCAELFALDPEAFVPIDSSHYGYRGALTLFERGQLGRFEVITPNSEKNTMGRFFARFGEVFYMAFGECPILDQVEERAIERGLAFTSDPGPEGRRGWPDTVFLHPATLGGMMLGLSRPTVAWRWSGSPERVEPRP